jgi:hypothetical protein
MTIARTIALAEQHAANGNVQGAIRILEGAARAAGSVRAINAYHAAIAKIAANA